MNDSHIFWKLLVLTVFVSLTLGESPDWASILENVSEDEKFDFLKNQVNRGYQLAHGSQSTLDSNPSAKLSLEIYEYYIMNDLVDPQDTPESDGVICFPDGTCIDLDDPGVHP